MKSKRGIVKQIILDTLGQRGPTKKTDLNRLLRQHAGDSTFDDSFNDLVAEGHLDRIHVLGQYRGQDVISLTGKTDLVMTEPVKPLPPVPAKKTYTYVEAVLMMVNDNASMSVPDASTPCKIQDGKIMWCDVALEVHQLFVVTDEYPYTQDEAFDAYRQGKGIENPSSKKVHRISDNDVSWLSFTRWKIHP